MFVVKLNHVVLLLIVHVTNCQRRITDGIVLNEGRKYVVYLIKAPVSPQPYNGWVCGGALVSSEFIVTSAACVTDVIHLYAIAGYTEYVSDEDINTNACTKEKKKKIILTCTPKAYELQYEQLAKWSYIDIAVVKVESPYNFEDESYATVCSYTPAPILINYEQKYQEPGIDALVFGWGHHDQYRQDGDPQNYNEQRLNYAPTLILNKEECKKEYELYDNMDSVIDRYMICTFDAGNINAKGESMSTPVPDAEGCDLQQTKLKGYEGVSCENPDKEGEEIILIENYRKGISATNKTRRNNNEKSQHSRNTETSRNVVDSKINQKYSLINKINNSINPSRRLNTRRHGICQNDHGGPLVTWIGAHEVLIGVASVFKITEDLNCVGPYLYASTQCNGRFLDCILRDDSNQTPESRREFCESPPSVKGFDLIETHISWKNHPHGPAENERNNTSTTHAKSTSTENPLASIEKKKNLEENYSTSTANLGNNTISNLIFKIGENKSSNHTIHNLMNGKTNFKKESKPEVKYQNYTKNVNKSMISNKYMNTTISNKLGNSTLSNQIIDTTISNEVMNSTISNLVTDTTTTDPINSTSMFKTTTTKILTKATTKIQ